MDWDKLKKIPISIWIMLVVFILLILFLFFLYLVSGRSTSILKIVLIAIAIVVGGGFLFRVSFRYGVLYWKIVLPIAFVTILLFLFVPTPEPSWPARDENVLFWYSVSGGFWGFVDGSNHIYENGTVIYNARGVNVEFELPDDRLTELKQYIEEERYTRSWSTRWHRYTWIFSIMPDSINSGTGVVKGGQNVGILWDEFIDNLHSYVEDEAELLLPTEEQMRDIRKRMSEEYSLEKYENGFLDERDAGMNAFYTGETNSIIEENRQKLEE